MIYYKQEYQTNFNIFSVMGRLSKSETIQQEN